MTVESEGKSFWQRREPAGAADHAAFDAMFRAYADHVFEYCNGLLGDEKAAAGATEATFITAYSLIQYLRNPRRMEAWLYALARRECTSKDPGRADLPPPGEPDTDEFPAVTDSVTAPEATAEAPAALAHLPGRDRAVLAAFGQLPPRDKEVIDLVYWRGIDRAELPYILGVSERRAAVLLTLAEKNLGQRTERALSAGTGTAPHEREFGPLTVMPATVWLRTVRAVFEEDCARSRRAVTTHAGPLDAEGFPEQPAPPAPRLPRAGLVTSAVVVPAVAGLVVLGTLGSGSPPSSTPPARAAHHGLTVAAPSPSPSPTPQVTAAHRAKARPHHQGHRTRMQTPAATTQIYVPPPVQPTSKPHPTTAPPPITTPPPSITASPSPTRKSSSPTPTSSPSK